jgi:hypothetical protein
MCNQDKGKVTTGGEEWKGTYERRIDKKRCKMLLESELNETRKDTQRHQKTPILSEDGRRPVCHISSWPISKMEVKSKDSVQVFRSTDWTFGNMSSSVCISASLSQSASTDGGGVGPCNG